MNQEEQKVLETIREEMARIKVPGGAQADPEATWEELDVDSLDLVELMRALEDRYGIEIPDERLEGVDTVGDAARATVGLIRQGAEA